MENSKIQYLKNKKTGADISHLKPHISHLQLVMTKVTFPLSNIHSAKTPDFFKDQVRTNISPPLTKQTSHLTSQT